MPLVSRLLVLFNLPDIIDFWSHTQRFEVSCTLNTNWTNCCWPNKRVHLQMGISSSFLVWAGKTLYLPHIFIKSTSFPLLFSWSPLGMRKLLFKLNSQFWMLLEQVLTYECLEKAIFHRFSSSGITMVLIVLSVFSLWRSRLQYSFS